MKISIMDGSLLSSRSPSSSHHQWDPFVSAFNSCALCPPIHPVRSPSGQLFCFQCVHWSGILHGQTKQRPDSPTTFASGGSASSGSPSAAGQLQSDMIPQCRPKLPPGLPPTLRTHRRYDPPLVGCKLPPIPTRRRYNPPLVGCNTGSNDPVSFIEPRLTADEMSDVVDHLDKLDVLHDALEGALIDERNPHAWWVLKHLELMLSAIWSE